MENFVSWEEIFFVGKMFIVFVLPFVALSVVTLSWGTVGWARGGVGVGCDACGLTAWEVGGEQVEGRQFQSFVLIGPGTLRHLKRQGSNGAQLIRAQRCLVRPHPSGPRGQ